MSLDVELEADAQLNIGGNEDNGHGQHISRRLPRPVLLPWSAPGGNAGQILTADAGGPPIGRKWRLRRVAAAAYPFANPQVGLASQNPRISAPGSVTNPTANQNIASVQPLLNGFYNVTFTIGYGATAPGLSNNWALYNNGANLGSFAVPQTANTQVTQTLQNLYCTSANFWIARAVSADTGTYVAQIIATPTSGPTGTTSSPLDMQVVLAPGGYSEITTPGALPGGELVWSFTGGLPYQADIGNGVIDVVPPMHVWVQLAFNSALASNVQGSISVIDEPRYYPLSETTALTVAGE